MRELARARNAIARRLGFRDYYQFALTRQEIDEEALLGLFDRLAADKQLCGGYHWGMPGCGTLATAGAGYVFAPRA